MKKVLLLATTAHMLSISYKQYLLYFLTDKLTCWTIDWLKVDWQKLTKWPTSWQIDLMNDRMIDWLLLWTIDRQTDRAFE